jgi:hypothetical protein
MKKYYFMIVGFLFFGVANAQIVTIPDANFRQKLLTSTATNGIAKDLAGNYLKIDANSDGQLQQSEILNVSFLNLNSTPTAMNSTKIQSLSGLEFFTNISVLFCAFNLIGNINTNNNLLLTQLICDSNYSNQQIDLLDLSNNVLLTRLDCSYTNIPNLSLYNNTALKSIRCNNVNFNFDFTNNTQLIAISCTNNNLNSLNLTNNIALISLDCSNNPLGVFSGGGNLDLTPFIALKSLTCNNCNLFNLNFSNSNLTYLSCEYNELTNLNINSSPALTKLYCNNNNLTSLDFSTSVNLITVDCSFNNLITLDLSNCIALTDLACRANTGGPYIKSLFVKNGQNENVGVDGNYLRYVCADESQIPTLLNYFFVYYQNYVNINDYCSFTPGGAYNTINCTSKLDINSNGCDVGDIIYPNMKYNIANGTVTGNIISDNFGNYFINVGIGSHVVTPVLENPTYFNISPTTTTVTFPTTENPVNRNFCVTANGIHSDIDITVLPVNVARPGFDIRYKIIYKNKGNQSQSGFVNVVFNDAVLDFVATTPIYTSFAANSLSWSFTDLLPFETREILVTLNANSPLETPSLNNGDILQLNATIASTTIDETPNDNVFVLNQTVVNSFDPNDKTCLEGKIITPSQVGKEVHYMIRFENNGTANAQNIVVKDMIDTAKFDVNSLIPIKGSHSFVTRITNTNKVEFIFENINLPFDDANNDGYVAFKIKTKPTLVLGNTFSNTASIYFDYNFPIVTNPAVTSVANVLSNQDFEFESYFTLSPNPAKEILTIDSNQDIAISSISIYNVLGQLVQVMPNAKDIKTIDVSSLKSGNYFVKVIADKGTSSSKFVKE